MRLVDVICEFSLYTHVILAVAQCLAAWLRAAVAALATAATAAALFEIPPRVTFNEIPAGGHKQFSLASRMLNAASCGSGAVWAGQGGSFLAGGGQYKLSAR